jgi:hypothetical protein
LWGTAGGHGPNHNLNHDDGEYLTNTVAAILLLSALSFRFTTIWSHAVWLHL